MSQCFILFDLGFCIFGMPHDILFNLGVGWPLGSSACTVNNILGPIFAYGDWYSLGLIAFTRALYIVKSKEWETFCNKKKNVFLLIGAIWAFNIILLIPRFFPNGREYVYDAYSDICQYVHKNPDESSDFSYELALLHRIPHYLAFTISTMIIIVSYIGIWWYVRESNKNIKGGIASMAGMDKQKKRNARQWRLTITLTIICVFFVVCVLPLILLEQFVNKIGFNGIISLYWTHYSINVVIYAARRDEFWKAYQDIFRIIFLPLKNMCFVKFRDKKNTMQHVNATAAINVSNEKFKELNKNCPTFDTHTNRKPNSSNIACEQYEMEPCINVKYEEEGSKLLENTPSNTKSQEELRSSSSKAIPDIKVSTTLAQAKNTDNKSRSKLILVVLLLVVSTAVVSLFVLMFTSQKTNSKLLVLGGYTSKDAQKVVCSNWLNDVEVIDLEKTSQCTEGIVQFSSHQALEDNNYFSEVFPKQVTDASGGLLDHVPLVCGGNNEDWVTSKSCYKMNIKIYLYTYYNDNLQIRITVPSLIFWIYIRK